MFGFVGIDVNDCMIVNEWASERDRGAAIPLSISILIWYDVFMFYMSFLWKHHNWTEETCLTPDNTNGQCIALRDCVRLFNIVLNFKVSTPAERDYVRRSQCGSNNRNPQVIIINIKYIANVNQK